MPFFSSIIPSSYPKSKLPFFSSNADPGTTNSSPPKGWPSLTLYGDLNMRPFRNLWMLEEIGLPYHHVSCKPWSLVAKSVHPLGKVPSLVVEYDESNSDIGDADRKFVVLESAAINTFLGDLTRKIDNDEENTEVDVPIFVPKAATKERAKYDSLAFFIMTEMDFQSLWIHRKHSDLKHVFGEAPVAVAEAKRQFKNSLEAMEEGIDDERYLIPSFGFCAADILFANCCFWAQQIGWLERRTGDADPKGEDSNEDGPIALSSKLEAYLKRCRSRPAFRRANELRKEQVEEKGGELLSKL